MMASYCFCYCVINLLKEKSRWATKKLCLWNACLSCYITFKSNIFSFHLLRLHVSLVWACPCQLTLLTRCRCGGTDWRTTCRFCFWRSGHILLLGWIRWNCAARHHKIYLHSFASRYSAISFWLSGSDHQRAVNLSTLINCNGKKIDFSSFCLNHKEQHNFSELPPSAYSPDIL